MDEDDEEINPTNPEHWFGEPREDEGFGEEPREPGIGEESEESEF